jgi:hypothetical protein
MLSNSPNKLISISDYGCPRSRVSKHGFQTSNDEREWEVSLKRNTIKSLKMAPILNDIWNPPKDRIQLIKISHMVFTPLTKQESESLFRLMTMQISQKVRILFSISAYILHNKAIKEFTSAATVPINTPTFVRNPMNQSFEGNLSRLKLGKI